MIVLDTSALMALLLDEPEADQIADRLKSEEEFTISAGTLAEALIVAGRRGISTEMSQLIEGIAVEIENLSAAGAIAVAEAYSVWGKGIHPAGLTLGIVSPMSQQRAVVRHYSMWATIFLKRTFARPCHEPSGT